MEVWMYIAGTAGVIVALGGGGWLYRTALRRGKKKGELEARIKAEMAAEEAVA